MTALQIILWVAIPYAAIAVFIVGHIWRYRYDKFGWTTRSSQLYEDRLLRWGSPLFHIGILAVFLGHNRLRGNRWFFCRNLVRIWCFFGVWRGRGWGWIQ